MNNFTPRAQQVLALARKEADRFHHNYVGTEHILLGLIKLGQGVAVSVLQKMGLDLETVRAAVEKQVGTGQETKTPRQHSLHSSREEGPRPRRQGSEDAQSFYVGTEHILLGLLREGEGVAARVFEDRWTSILSARAMKSFASLIPSSPAAVQARRALQAKKPLPERPSAQRAPRKTRKRSRRPRSKPLAAT